MSAEQETIPRWLLSRWKPLLALVPVALVVTVICALLTSNPSVDVRASALWPVRLSATTGAKLPVFVDDYDDDTSDHSGTATLYRGSTDEIGNLAAVFDDTFVEIAAGKIAADGTGVLDIPPVEPLDDESSAYLVLKVEALGETVWLRRDLQVTDAATMALTLDRPLYQPGQTIKMRALVASATNGKPIDDEVTFKVTDARSNLVFEEKATTGADGVAHTQFELAARCVQGSYRVEVLRKDAVTAKQVDVRPFRLPRFKVEVLPSTAIVEPGTSLAGRVQATYTYGEPVVDASVAVVATLGTLPLPTLAGTTDDAGTFDFVIPVPKNATKGARIAVAATVTSPSGRAETGAGSSSVAGRSVNVELIPSRNATFEDGRSQTAYLLVTMPTGEPVEGAEVKLVYRQNSTEHETTKTTDAHGRVSWTWTPSFDDNYVTTTVTANGAVVFQQNLTAGVGYGGPEARVEHSVVEAGGILSVTLGAREAVVALVRDGVPLSAVRKKAGDTTVELPIPPEAAGQAEVAVLSASSSGQTIPLWVRQKGGDKVDVSVEPVEVRPGTKATVSLAFPPGRGKSAGPAPVTFGLVAVDEALYALKERADVPLHVLMRRAPSSVAHALEAFDGVASNDAAGLDIATSRFRTRIGNVNTAVTSGYDVTREFRRHGRRPLVYLSAFIFILIGLILVGRMLTWTWSVADRSAFSWRRVSFQVGFSMFCMIFGAILLVGGTAFIGGLSVWSTIVMCWLIAAAVRLPNLPLDRWLWAHLVVLLFLAAAGVLTAELVDRSADGFEWVLIVALVLPLPLTAIQWIVWSFVLMREGHTQAGLGLGSFVICACLLAFSAVLWGCSKFESGGMTLSSPMRMAKDEVQFAAAPAEEKEAGQSAPGLAAEGGGGAERGGPRVRSWFPETMVWLPEIGSDADGRATVDVEVPDSITTWRLDAWANSQDGRFGQGQAKLVAVKPYFVEVDVPTEVVAGDRFEVPVTLVNRSGDPLEVDLRADASGALSLRGADGGTWALQPGQRKMVTLDVLASDVGPGAITVSSQTAEGVDTDAVKRTVRVAPDGRVLRESTSGIVGEGWEAELDVPRDTIANTRVADVRVFPSLVADALAGLDGMLRQPGGCFEQTSSANYPNVMVLRALRDTKPDEWPDGAEAWQETHDEATRFVRLGYQRILTFQKPGGGFAIYPDRYEADVMLTAYGILQLAWARDVTTVDENVIRRAADWLVARQDPNGSWPLSRSGFGSTSSAGGDVGNVRATALVVMALAALDDERYRAVIARGSDRIVERMTSVESANALAYAANALVDAKRLDDAKKAVDRLGAMVTREGDVAFWRESHPTWMGGWSTYADHETTAVAARALLEAKSNAELIQPVLNYIARGRSPWGGWGSTQTTVWTLRTLEALNARSSDASTLRFYFDSAQLQTVGGADTLEVTKGPQPVRQFQFTPSGNVGRFVVDSSAETTATVQLVSEYAVDWESQHAARAGEPFAGDLELDDRSMQRGRRVRAYARVGNVRETDISMVIVEVPVPPGAFVPNEPLDQMQSAGAIDTYEILPTHIRLYVSQIPGKHERLFTYEFTPLVVGTFSLPPLRAYPFYAPEPMMEMDPGEVRTR